MCKPTDKFYSLAGKVPLSWYFKKRSKCKSVINKTLNSQSKLFVASKKGKHFGCHNKSSQSIFFGPTFKLCQRRLILSPFPLKTRRPTPPARPAHLSHPSFQAKNGDLLFNSAQHFSENVKFIFYCLSL